MFHRTTKTKQEKEPLTLNCVFGDEICWKKNKEEIKREK